jgi:uncharacterized RDD family membrane protein YckC
MQSSEPIVPRDVSNHQTDENDETWRDEVASRVNSYRARRKRSSDAPNLDFGAAVGSDTLEVPSGELRIPVHPSHVAFDTNYYRRMNAQSLGDSGGTMGATVAAALAKNLLEGEPETKTGIEPSSELPQEANDDLALDLEICPTEAAVDSYLDRYSISEPEPEAEAVITPPAPVVQGNLIVFRRPLLEPPLAPQPSYDELAEPMNRRPRILEVPEDIMPPVQGSLFPEIRLDTDEQEASSKREPEIEVPLPVAPVAERFVASLLDLAVVMAAGLLFGWMALRALPEIPHNKPFFLMLGAATVLLWAVYQHLFLLYAGRTPGMAMRGIRLSAFDGRTPTWKQRLSRALFIFISFASVNLGFLWALVDEDTLCWHDRISRTFPTRE